MLTRTGGLILALCLCALPLFGAGQASPPVVKAFVGIPPMAFFVKRVGGARVEVRVLVPPGQSPHMFEPTPKQMAAMDEAQVYFQIGLPFEDRLVRKLKGMDNALRIVDCRRGIHLRRADPHDGRQHRHAPGNHDRHERETDKRDARSRRREAEFDPHIWLNPRLVKQVAANICDGLVAIRPGAKELFRKNLEAFQEELDKVDSRVAKVLKPCRGMEFLVFHPAFGYFGQAYGIRQRAVEFEGKEPSAKGMIRITKEARQRGIKIIFVQPQFSKKSAQVIASAIDGAVVAIDPLAADYLANLEDMAAKVQKALAKPKDR